MSETGLLCPECGSAKQRVLESRPSVCGLGIRRRRKCQSCDCRFTTLERATADEPCDIAKGRKWQVGDYVMKKGGAHWRGRCVGHYQTKLTPRGYAVESSNESGSVQIYPEQALMDWHPPAHIRKRDHPKETT